MTMTRKIAAVLAAVVAAALIAPSAGADSHGGGGRAAPPSGESGCISATTDNGPEMICYGAPGDNYLYLSQAREALEASGATFAFVVPVCVAMPLRAWQSEEAAEPSLLWMTSERRAPGDPNPTGEVYRTPPGWSPGDPLPLEYGGAQPGDPVAGRWALVTPQVADACDDRLFGWGRDGDWIDDLEDYLDGGRNPHLSVGGAGSTPDAGTLGKRWQELVVNDDGYYRFPGE